MLHVRGYDDAQNPIIEVEQNWTESDGAHATLTTKISHDGVTNVMILDANASADANDADKMSIAVTARENAFPSDAKAREILGILASDAQTQGPRATLANGAPSTSTSSILHDRLQSSYWGESLVNDLTCGWTSGCAFQLVKSSVELLTGAASCALLVSSAVAAGTCIIAGAPTVALAAGCAVAEAATAPEEASGCVAGVTAAYKNGKNVSDSCSCK